MTSSDAGAAQGLLLVFQTVPPQHDDEFCDWYTREHIPERQAINGFVAIRRMDSMDKGQPRYMGVYEMTSPAVLEKPEYTRLRKEGRTTWSMRVLERVSPARFNCKSHAPILVGQLGTTRFVMAIAGEADPSAVVELSNWFDEVYKPAISQVEGVRLVRRFEVIGEPNKFVALIDVETPDVCSSDRYLERREQSGAERRFGKLRNLIARIYEQEAK